MNVRAYSDFSSEGERNASLQHLVVSNDLAYDGKPVLNEQVRVIDDDRAGVVVLPTGVDTFVSESGITDSYVVALTRAPTPVVL